MYRDAVYQAADYLRLSKEDGDFSASPGKRESNSISSQRDLIRSYVAKCPDIELTAEFVDDGFSGTSFDRPGFQRMMEAVEAGEINCVIVKDLSRFGREYIDAGQYIEKLFPQKGVRFIAVNDNYDSLSSTSASDSLIIPFKNLINDSYSRDISIKIRTNLEAKRNRGEFIANFPVYGYMRDPENKNHLVADEEAAGVVRSIFAWKLEGFSPDSIARRLNACGIKSPAAYKRAHGSHYTTGFQSGGEAMWSSVAVTRILKNEVYCGVLIQGRRTTANYKVKRVITKPEQNWTRFEDAHEPIINRNQYHLVQQLMQEECRRFREDDFVRPLSGRVWCGACGSPAKRRVTQVGGKKYIYFICPNGGKHGLCDTTPIRETELEEAVLATLRMEIGTVLDMDRALREMDAMAWESRERQRLERQIAEQEALIEKSNSLRLSAYEDFREGMIDREELNQIKDELSRRLQNQKKALDALRVRRDEVSEGMSSEQEWLTQFRMNRNISELNRSTVVTLIDKIRMSRGKQIQIELRHRDQIRKIAEYLQAQETAPEKMSEGAI